MEHARPLIKDRDFAKLWFGLTAANFGSQVNYFAISLTAVSVLGASSLQMGYIGVANYAPYVFFTLFVGVLVDRMDRRTLMVVANVSRASIVSLIPITALAGVLNLGLMYVVVFFTAVITVFFELSYQSYVPAVVGTANLVEANGKIQAISSASQIAGPGLAGVLVQLITAPLTLLGDSLSYVAAAGAFFSISKREGPVKEGGRGGVFRGIREGMSLVVRDPFLRGLAGEASTFNMLSTGVETILVLYFVQVLGFSPLAIGVVVAMGSVGSILGGAAAHRLSARIRLGRAMVLSYLVACAPSVGFALAGGGVGRALVVSGLTFVALGFGTSLSQVYVWSLRQAITPPRLLGRMNAAYRFIVTGVGVVGAPLGGVLGAILGLRAAIGAMALLELAALLWVVSSPIPRLASLPAPSADVRHT